MERDREKITVIHASKKTSYVLPTRLQADEFYAAHCILTRTPFPPPFSPTPLLRIFLEKKPPLFTLEPADWVRFALCVCVCVCMCACIDLTARRRRR